MISSTSISRTSSTNLNPSWSAELKRNPPLLNETIQKISSSITSKANLISPQAQQSRFIQTCTHQRELQKCVAQDLRSIQERVLNIQQELHAESQKYEEVIKSACHHQTKMAVYNNILFIQKEALLMHYLSIQYAALKGKLEKPLQQKEIEFIQQQINLFKLQITEFKVQLSVHEMQKVYLKEQMLQQELFLLTQLQAKVSGTEIIEPQSGKHKRKIEDIDSNQQSLDSFTNSKKIKKLSVVNHDQNKINIIKIGLEQLSEKEMTDKLSESIVNSVDENGDTVLHIAVFINKVWLCKAIIKKSCDINRQNNEGNTPLHEAFKNKKWKIVKTLLKYDAKMNAENLEGLTPEMMSKTMPKEIRNWMKENFLNSTIETRVNKVNSSMEFLKTNNILDDLCKLFENHSTSSVQLDVSKKVFVNLVELEDKVVQEDQQFSLDGSVLDSDGIYMGSHSHKIEAEKKDNVPDFQNIFEDDAPKSYAIFDEWSWSKI